MAVHTRRITNLLVGAVVGAAVLAPAASAQYPPPPGPDPSTMAIGVADLPPGSIVTQQGATKMPGADSAYQRTFVLRPRAARAAGFVVLDSTVALYSDATAASEIFAMVRKDFGSRAGRRAFARAVAQDSGVPVRRVKVGSPADLHVGDESFGVPVAVRFRGGTLREVFSLARVDRAIARVVTVSPASAASLMRRTAAMLDKSAQHIRGALLAPAASR